MLLDRLLIFPTEGVFRESGKGERGWVLVLPESAVFPFTLDNLDGNLVAWLSVLLSAVTGSGR